MVMVEFGTSSTFRGWVRVTLTRALRARPPEVPEKAPFSCFAAARAACVSTWLGEGLGFWVMVLE